MMALEQIIDTEFECCNKAANQIIEAINDFNEQKRLGKNEKEYFVLGLATGSSPKLLYDLLVEAENDNRVSFENVVTFNLDEYIGLSRNSDDSHQNHKESYERFMYDNLFSRLYTPPNKTFFPGDQKSFEGNPNVTTGIETSLLEIELRNPNNVEKLGNSNKGKAIIIPPNTTNKYLSIVRRKLDEYESLIKEYNGIDIQVLGVGIQGHLGFHESGIPFCDKTRMLLVELDNSTRQKAVDDGYFTRIDDVPKYALSMGASLIEEAKEAIVLAWGENKKEIIKDFHNSNVSDQIPLTIIKQMDNVTLYIDYKCEGRDLEVPHKTIYF